MYKTMKIFVAAKVVEVVNCMTGGDGGVDCRHHSHRDQELTVRFSIDVRYRVSTSYGGNPTGEKCCW